MTQSRPERPLLATIICFYEGIIPLSAIASFFLLKHMQLAVTDSEVQSHPMSLLFSLTWLSYVLAVAAAIALWQMRRLAFILLAGRFGLSLLKFFIELPRFLAQHWPILPPGSSNPMLTMVYRGSYYITFAAVPAISAAMAWFVYLITSPKILPPTASDPELSA